MNEGTVALRFSGSASSSFRYRSSSGHHYPLPVLPRNRKAGRIQNEHHTQIVMEFRSVFQYRAQHCVLTSTNRGRCNGLQAAHIFHS